MSKTNIFCFPYAGGASNVFLKWKRYLDPSMNLVPVELAGRLKRSNEPLKYEMQSIVDDCYEIIKDELNNAPYIMFGHSMGSIIICELLDRIYKYQKNRPKHVFLSGRNPAHIECNHAYYKLPDDEFIKQIIDIGGTSPELFENKQLKELFLPILKADFQAVETYKREKSTSKWDINLTILNGREDKLLDKKVINEWDEYTKGNVNYHYFNGGHFYLNTKFIDIVQLINKTASSMNYTNTKRII